MTPRERWEALEEEFLSPWAAKAARSRGRLRPEAECPLRTCFQRDRDRIIHSKAFRRLKHKTQVFLAPTGDHYRTRLTHTLEVAQIARTMARALRLNEDLTEAIALGHDLGHTPFGHAGEEVLNELMPGGFRHYEQSLRVVDCLEKEGRGLNLTHEVRDGILKHSKGLGPILSPEDDPPLTLEAQVVRLADLIAYVNHDLDDALRAGIIRERDIPKDCLQILGHRHAARINTVVQDTVQETLAAGDGRLHLSERVLRALSELREFLFERVYRAREVRREFEKARRVLIDLFEYYLRQESVWEKEMPCYEEGIYKERMVCDFIAGMTDRYALYLYEKLFLPRPYPITLTGADRGD
ncbi:deoxyguanosinetriphosphate triphosphohydrolase [Thermosulfurimonas marina]|uniref:Deoxyguanosinetriphosphate triphosphohydrolase-like protein n=1 Tax=Thermosulfurimonas marina TaxID=2047767 RepID=A0A6H1WTZ4_9BACT|nr:deoxyguanosinetriphosphate triphosphohydrolase [Thermosulfurimonas marina]QJA06672.1 deoxyguanosinetriphosphate triphosphohydrolase [Thermosulfurimonas marina]